MKQSFLRTLSIGTITALLLAGFTACSAYTKEPSFDIASTPSEQSGSSTAADNDSSTHISYSAALDIPPEHSLPSADAVIVTDFAVRLFQQSLEPEENTLISPLSVMNALVMTANGANGETLSQMGNLFGADIDSLCSYLSDYQSSIPSDKKYQFHNANSIWIKNDNNFTVNQDFIKTNQDLFNAEIFQADFDQSTLKSINKWVSKNTDKLIPEILDRIPEDAVMYLVNALAFDAEWQTIYKETQIHDGVFTKEDDTEQQVKMMYCEENAYLQDERARGFLKYYADSKYAFAALLPDEGISLTDYVNSLTGERLHRLLTDAAHVTVNTAIPKFRTGYSVEMSDILKSMGLTDAFDEYLADFTGIGSYHGGNLSVSRVLHKTYLALDEKGTKAGAATVVEMKAESAMMEQEIKTVHLDRPFLYMIIDCEENLPIFMGTVMSTE